MIKQNGYWIFGEHHRPVENRRRIQVQSKKDEEKSRLDAVSAMFSVCKFEEVKMNHIREKNLLRLPAG